MQSVNPNYPIGRNIAKLRYGCGLTQDQVIAKLGIFNIPVSKSRYAKIETDRINIRVNELAALKNIFKCSYEDFFRGVDEMFLAEIKDI